MPRRKPTLALLAGSRALNAKTLAVFFEKVTGRKVTQEEIQAAKTRLSRASNSHRLKTAQFSGTSVRRQGEAYKEAAIAYPMQCCVVCGLQIATCITVAHLDQQAANNSPDNLAFLCWTHHWMYDAGLYPISAIKLLRTHWQETKGVPSHKARMKDAGAKAAQTRKRRATARKAVETRKANAMHSKKGR